MVCEKCWADAATIMRETGEHQYTAYKKLLEERKDNPCPPSVLVCTCGGYQGKHHWSCATQQEQADDR